MSHVHAPLAPKCAILSLLLIVAFAGLPPASAEQPFDQLYTKYEHLIPMRDGVKLFTAVYIPKEAGLYPILLQRTPYSVKPYTIDARNKPDSLPDSYVREKFIFALQDVRGRYASGGKFVEVRPIKSQLEPGDTDERTDTYDTIEWLVHHIPGNNGCVGLQGISYPGFFAAAGMIDSHPALKAVSPQAPVADMYGGDDVLHGGGFWLPHNFGFFTFFGQPTRDDLREEPPQFDYRTPDGYEFFLRHGSVGELGRKFLKENPYWNELMTNIRNAEWCAARDITPRLKNVHASVLTVGGWFDAEDLHGALKTYRATEAQNPGIFNAIVMGPWSHGAWHGEDGEALGPVRFSGKTAEFFREQIELPFWRKFLKGAADIDIPEAWVFETGTDIWRKHSAWPPTNALPKTLWFQERGGLAFNSPASGSGYDEYISDPAHPVPFTSQITTGMPREYMVEDQRFAARRPDVLVYQTDPLDQDLTIAGPITATLHVSTSGTDSDWVVKIIDVYTGDYPEPNVRMGHYQQLVRGEPLRGKFRQGMDRPEPFTPGQITPLEWTMPDVYHTFRRGHRVMIQVQSTWFPLLDLNPQTFCDIFEARPDQFHAAVQRVYHTAQHPSGLRVHVVE